MNRGLAASDLPSGLGDIGLALARLVYRMSGGDELLARTAALASRERSLGHVCVHLADHAGAPERAGEAGEERFRWPQLVTWRERLVASGMVASGMVPEDGAEPPLTPMVLDGADRLYLSCYFRAERRLARGVAACAARSRETSRYGASPDDLDDSEALFRHLFPPENERMADQAAAARAALRGGLTLISGGPGTGKTTTVARILALLLASRPELRVALAAPTGKAAARLAESIHESITEMGGDAVGTDAVGTDAVGTDAVGTDAVGTDAVGTDAVGGDSTFRDVLPHVPRQAKTLHRLLGYSPRRDRFRHRAEEPLPYDVVVVDEASMVDLLLMDALVDALPEHGSLVLLGDRDQLASVEAGFVFGDLCIAAGLGDRDGTDSAPLEGAGVELRHSWRFQAQAGIGDLARAVRSGRAGAARAVLDDPEQHEVSLHRHGDAEALLAPIAESLDAYLAADAAATALERLAEFRILCATRVGPWGVDRVNRLVEAHVARRGHPTSDRFYPRRPILVRQNDYQSQLFNGDLGICWRDGRGLRAVFPGGDSLRSFPLAKLPRHDTAWAMTIHQSQGSEFDRVLLLLPEDAETGGGMLGRELIYTGITRARRRVDLVASDEVLAAALARSSRRRSGLVDALAAG